MVEVAWFASSALRPMTGLCQERETAALGGSGV